jgi:site-specific recombinase XerD
MLLSEIRAETIIAFLASCSSVSPKTLLNYHTGLSSLLRWACEHGIVAQNVVRQVRTPRQEERVVIPYARADVLRLLDACYTGEHPQRDQAIILLLLDTGIRASELCGLRLAHVELEARQLYVRGKGSRERRLPFSEPCYAAMRAYLQQRHIVNLYPHRYEPLFITGQGRPFRRDTLRQILERLGTRGGVARCYAHRFRHTFAIQFLRNGGNIYTLQRLLGHSSLDMVKRYLSIAQADLDRDHARASPVIHWGLSSGP